VHRERSGQTIFIILVSEHQVDHGAELLSTGGSSDLLVGEVCWRRDRKAVRNFLSLLAVAATQAAWRLWSSDLGRFPVIFVHWLQANKKGRYGASGRSVQSDRAPLGFSDHLAIACVSLGSRSPGSSRTWHGVFQADVSSGRSTPDALRTGQGRAIKRGGGLPIGSSLQRDHISLTPPGLHPRVARSAWNGFTLAGRPSPRSVCLHVPRSAVFTHSDDCFAPYLIRSRVKSGRRKKRKGAGHGPAIKKEARGGVVRWDGLQPEKYRNWCPDRLATTFIYFILSSIGGTIAA
jgi:hypothetical protein